MSDDPGSKKPAPASIPSWQRAHSTTDQPQQSEQADSISTSQPIEQTSAAPEETADMPMSEKAARFLDDESIKNASRERKIAFLQTKGIPLTDIEKLLDSTQEAPSLHPTTDEARVIHSSSASEKVVQTSSMQKAKRDVPPIVTYPEFLVQSQKPPPLVTTQRLLTTAYITGGLMATAYGLSKYIIEPMSETLTAARHDFLEHSAAHIDELNSRLEKSVSNLPTDTKHASKLQELEAPPSPTDSDPTELFHRDVGTQTTPELERPSYGPSTPSTESDDSITHQESRLRSIKSHITDLQSSSETHELANSDLTTKLNDLTSYLEQMSYREPSYKYWYGSETNSSGGTTKSGEDEIDKVKAEIRSVKGVLLSARNFPGARAVGVK